MKEKKKLSLPAWIFIGMLAGIVAGLIFAFAGLGDFTTEWIKPIGTIYVNLLKFLVVPVVLFSIADGVISLKDLKRVGSVGVKTFVYYMCTTALAVVIGLVLVNLFKGSFTPLPSADLGALEYEAKEAPSVMQVIVNIFPDNFSRWSPPTCCRSSSSPSSSARASWPPVRRARRSQSLSTAWKKSS